MLAATEPPLAYRSLNIEPAVIHLRQKQKTRREAGFFDLAVREGFEPSIGINLYTLSRRAPSTARTPHPDSDCRCPRWDWLANSRAQLYTSGLPKAMSGPGFEEGFRVEPRGFPEGALGGAEVEEADDGFVGGKAEAVPHPGVAGEVAGAPHGADAEGVGGIEHVLHRGAGGEQLLHLRHLGVVNATGDGDNHQGRPQGQAPGARGVLGG